jgi:competence protein ComEC
LGPRDRYIDAVVLTHPQLDHYGGLIDILRRYDVGIFASNGMTSDVAAYGDLLQTLRMRHVRQVTLSAGDSIVSGGDRFAVVWPDATAIQSGNPNFMALVMEYSGGGMKVLLTSDADAKMEMAVLPRLSGRINVLKVSHHGSKYSSAQEFLSAIQPQVAVIEVGKNSYGHPDPAVLERLAAVGAFTLRTDQDGLIGVAALNGRMAISQMGLMQNLSAGY